MRLPTNPLIRQIAGAVMGALLALALYQAFEFTTTTFRAYAFPPTEEGEREEKIDNIVLRARTLLEESRP